MAGEGKSLRKVLHKISLTLTALLFTRLHLNGVLIGSRDHTCDVRETVFAEEENLETWVQCAAGPNGPGEGRLSSFRGPSNYELLSGSEYSVFCLSARTCLVEILE